MSMFTLLRSVCTTTCPLLAAVGLLLGLAGCPKSGANVVTNPGPVATNPAVCNSPQPAASDGCTLAQRVCLLLTELPAALSQADFIPEPKYAQRWQPRVQRWSSNLSLLASDSQVGAAALDVSSMVDLIGKGAKERREISGAPALAIGQLRALGLAAEKGVGAGALGCPIPADPVTPPAAPPS